jgi:hypothetical protein
MISVRMVPPMNNAVSTESDLKTCHFRCSRRNSDIPQEKRYQG